MCACLVLYMPCLQARDGLGSNDVVLLLAYLLDEV